MKRCANVVSLSGKVKRQKCMGVTDFENVCDTFWCENGNEIISDGANEDIEISAISSSKRRSIN